MSDSFESNVKFPPEDIELMSIEIGDILGRLKTKSVFDLEKEKPIILLDRSMAHVQFRKTDLLEVHRLVALVQKNMPALEYLVKNPSFFTVIDRVEREDRLMGAIDYGKTLQLRTRNVSGKSKVACLEIHRSYNTPENILLTQVLFSIMLYCDKYIIFEGLIEARDRKNPTLDSLRAIRGYVSTLLSRKFMKDMLPIAVSSMQKSDELFNIMLKRIKSGRTPKYYVGIFNLLYPWRNQLWTALSDTEIVKHVLKYHFLTVENQNDLYECWVFCKIFDAITDVFQLRFKEMARSEGTTFRSHDGTMRVTYQKRYHTGWEDKKEDRWVEDKPDISIEFANAPAIIIDAKNSDFDSRGAYPYREPMDSYIGSAKANHGILVFSKSKQSLWEYVIRKEQKIVWTSLSPGQSEKNDKAIKEIMKLIGNN